MNDPKLDLNNDLIAQNDGHNGGEQHQGGDQHQAGGHQEVDANAEGNSAKFTKLLGQLGDHREIEIGPLHIVDLPVILIDDGLHIWPNVEAMEEEGTYILKHNLPESAKEDWAEIEKKDHKSIVRVSDQQAPALDISITSLVVFQWLAMILLIAIFVPMGRKSKKLAGRAHKGFYNAMEGLVEYLRDNLVIPNVGNGKVGKSLTPVLLTFFTFILTMNLIGLIPGGHSATGSLSVTAGLAIIAFFVIQYAAIRDGGIIAWFKHLTGGTPMAIWPIMIPVEILGLFAKPFALCVRLFANMTGGHVVILSLIGLIFVLGIGFAPVSVAFSLFINLLELLVAFIQAYIFTILVAVFASMGMHAHDEHEEEGHATAH
ncbi:MAG: F0F1 ATP synthase subunit A [Ignavibacteriae bacterium]|nr:F0F1 ATP synthase subunit A [Ignavibacteriota bacterium]MCB9216109.1 F0F1 ATP synthase subunit A [Ignavibacteria bacterium]